LYTHIKILKNRLGSLSCKRGRERERKGGKEKGMQRCGKRSVDALRQSDTCKQVMSIPLQLRGARTSMMKINEAA
jgi:hypothetical protein